MITIDKIIVLETYREDQQLSFEICYLVESSFTFEIAVLSGNFSGKAHFCADGKAIGLFAQDLDAIDKKMAGMARLEDMDSDGFIEFLMDSPGSLSVRGQIGGTHEDHFVRFRFSTDQTVLRNFVAGLNSLDTYQDFS